MTAKDSKRKRHINECMRTSFTSHGSRAAGMGILYDDYSEDSGNPIHGSKNPYPIYTTDWLSENEKKFREEGGPVITYRIEDLEGVRWRK